MGRQIRFCDIAPAYLQALGAHAQEASPGAVWVPLRFPESRPPTRPAQDLDAKESGHLIRAADLDRVETYYVRGQGYWVVDELPSPVIECNIQRLFIHSGYVEGVEVDRLTWVPRDADFIAWYDDIVRWVRRTLRYERDRGCWSPREP